jgi:hypothetical protein
VNSLAAFLLAASRGVRPAYLVALPWAALLLIDEFFDVKDLLVFQQIVYGSPQAMSHNAFGLVLAILAFNASDIGLNLTGFP